MTLSKGTVKMTMKRKKREVKVGQYQSSFVHSLAVVATLMDFILFVSTLIRAPMTCSFPVLVTVGIRVYGLNDGYKGGVYLYGSCECIWSFFAEVYPLTTDLYNQDLVSH